jgi:hypothetical protein
MGGGLVAEVNRFGQIRFELAGDLQLDSASEVPPLPSGTRYQPPKIFVSLI